MPRCPGPQIARPSPLRRERQTPDLFPFRASTLVNYVPMQIVKTIDGNHQSAAYFSLP